MEGKKQADSRGQKRKHEGEESEQYKKAPSILSGAPRELIVTDYAESRAVEIEALNEAVAIVGGGKKVQQKLPRHMRRRAMSHNIKRLPRGVRRFAKHEYKNQQHLTKKKPSRYHRRRPKNLLAEYNRRRQKHVWLETHIWHAKRFHMVKKWGHCLPWKPTDKSERAAYRASRDHCLLQDQSYMCCIELSGDQQLILDGLSHITSTQTGMTFAAKACLPGCREGHVVLYGIDTYPYNAIGPVSFLWRPAGPISAELSAVPTEPESANHRQLWVWCHPACFGEVWNVLLKCLHLSESVKEEIVKDMKSETNDNKNGPKSDDKNISKKETSAEQFKFSVMAKDVLNNVSMKSLSGDLLRFRLTGPQSNAVIMDALQQANIVPSSNGNDRWWTGFYSNQQYSLGNTLQREFAEAVGQCWSPAELRPHCIVGMTVRDPRLTRHRKRTKVTTQTIDMSVNPGMFSVTPDLATSALWEGRIRQEVKDTRETDYRIHQLKSEQLIPGTSLDLGDEESRIPVILVQQPGVSHDSSSSSSHHDPCLGRGSGWDVILPSGWGMPFWLSLVYCGARCGGLHEAECLAFEQRAGMFPSEFPDTRSGLQCQLDVENTYANKYNRRPPAKRVNYVKFGVISPFLCPFSNLVQDWKNSKSSKEKDVKENGYHENGELGGVKATESSVVVTETLGDNTHPRVPPFFVLRDFKAVRKLRQVTRSTEKTNKMKGKSAGNNRNVTDKVKQDILAELEKNFGNSVVCVNISMLERGSPNKFAMICIPSDSDMDNLNKIDALGGPVENVHEDPAKTDRKLKKKLLKEKKIKKLDKVDRNMKPFHSKEAVNVKGSCDRQIIGYLNSGGFSLGVGNGSGVGLCTVLGVVQLIKGARKGFEDLVLVRNPSSRQYRFVRLSVGSL